MKIEIGKIVKAQGIKGEVKLACYLDDVDMLKGVEHLFVQEREYAVEKIRFDGAFCYVLLKGVADRNAAEELKDCAVFAWKEDLKIKPNRYFVNDLIGCKVIFEDKTPVGEVVDVLQYGAADVFVCQNGSKQVSFPFLNDLVISVDVEKKTITVLRKRFAEVSVYDD